MNFHEEMFARNFIVPAKRQRYLSLLENPMGRSKLVFGLNHCRDIDMRYATQVPVGQQYVDAIVDVIKTKGAPDLCHVMSSNLNTDDQDMPLPVSLSNTLGMGCGTLISCIPGRLAYFEFEDPGERYILER
jgi:hypothetical protein